ncbi:MAG: hypothetical protein K1X94_30995 [Sandaracinaceae bacterium]|nr:hypothetical protein [Sandaracinaceae bacterium]
MRQCFSVALTLASLLALAGCSSDPAPGDAAADLRDAARADDAAGLDAAATTDAATTADAPATSDAPAASDDASRDAASSGDAWRDLCPAGLGAVCDDTAVCPAGFECMVGRCAPQARQICGGFAGARCTDLAYPTCMYFSSADFGPCLTPDEQRCICADPERAAGFACL